MNQVIAIFEKIKKPVNEMTQKTNNQFLFEANNILANNEFFQKFLARRNMTLNHQIRNSK